MHWTPAQPHSSPGHPPASWGCRLQSEYKLLCRSYTCPWPGVESEPQSNGKDCNPGKALGDVKAEEQAFDAPEASLDWHGEG